MTPAVASDLTMKGQNEYGNAKDWNNLSKNMAALSATGVNKLPDGSIDPQFNSSFGNWLKLNADKLKGSPEFAQAMTSYNNLNQSNPLLKMDSMTAGGIAAAAADQSNLHIEKGNQYINGANQNRLGTNPSAPTPPNASAPTNAQLQKMSPADINAERTSIKAALKANPSLNYNDMMTRFKQRTGQDL